MTDAAPNAEPGRAVEDRYEVVRKLGEGSSAETFLARDLEANGREVVVVPGDLALIAPGDVLGALFDAQDRADSIIVFR